MKSQLVCAGILALAVAAASERASADVFRCPMPDGTVVFTDREDGCPGAQPHTITKQVQTYAPTPAALEPPNARSPRGVRGTDPQPGLWREKKNSAEQELKALQEKWDYLNQYITHCNRYGKVLSANASGLRYEVSCKNIRQEHAQVKVRLNEVRLYLDETLEEECRRAGCLPGWIR